MKYLFNYFLFFFSLAQAGHIQSNGAWCGADVEHCCDQKLAISICDFLHNENAKYIADFGCGNGAYTRIFNEYGFDCRGFDGNPETNALTNGLCEVLDLSKVCDLQCKFDWVVSLEVGEHLPKEFENTFISNLVNHARSGIILSWAVPNQGGWGHFNEQPNDYIKQKFSDLGWENDIASEQKLRLNSTLPWFPNTVMVFKKKNKF